VDPQLPTNPHSNAKGHFPTVVDTDGRFPGSSVALLDLSAVPLSLASGVLIDLEVGCVRGGHPRWVVAAACLGFLAVLGERLGMRRIIWMALA
jgi:hypothetical protein